MAMVSVVSADGRPAFEARMGKNACDLAGVVFPQFAQAFPSTNRCSARDFLARQRHQELIAFSLIMTIFLVWSIGARTGEREKWEGSAEVLR